MNVIVNILLVLCLTEEFFLLEMRYNPPSATKGIANSISYQNIFIVPNVHKNTKDCYGKKNLGAFLPKSFQPCWSVFKMFGTVNQY